MDNDLKEALTALLKAELSLVFERLDVIEKRLDKIEVEQIEIKQVVTGLSESIKKMELNQEQQQGIIDLLSFRSIAQEANIKFSKNQ